MADTVDPVQFGRLIGGMEHLTASITDLTQKVESLEARMNTGKGFVFGLTIAAAGAGGAVGAFAHRILDGIKG